MSQPKSSNDIIPYSQAAIGQNAYLLDYYQTSLSALSGCAAGIIGLTGTYGFLFYFICSFVFSFLLVAYLATDIKKYFISWQPIFTGNLWSGLQTYVLFWTFLYGIVNVY